MNINRFLNTSIKTNNPSFQIQFPKLTSPKLPALFRTVNSSLMNRFAKQASKQPRKVFIDIKRFDQKGVLLIYQSKENRQFAILQLVLLVYIGYNFYNYYQQRYELKIDSVDVYIPLNFGLLLCGFLGVLQYRIARTPVSIYLNKTGSAVLVRRMRMFCLGQYDQQINVQHTLGFNSFFSSNSKIPIFKYQLTTTKADFYFFKTIYVLDEQIFRACFEGRSIVVAPENQHLDVSNRFRKKYTP